MSSMRTVQLKSYAPWLTVLAVLGIAAVVTFFRISVASNELLWLDELHTSWVVGDGLGSVVSRAADGNQAPFFFWLTWFAVSFVEATEFSVRLVSLLAGIGVLVVASLLTWKWTRSAIASVVVAALVGLDVQFLYYATEARPYCLVQFLGGIQVLCFWRFLNDFNFQFCLDHEGTKARSLRPHWGVVISSALLFYTHYTSAWLFVAEVLFFAVAWFGGFKATQTEWEAQTERAAERRHFLTRASVSAGFLALISIPIFLQMLEVFQRRGNWVGVSSIPQVAVEQAVPLASWVLFPLICLVIAALFRFKGFEVTSDGAGNGTLENGQLWKIPSLLSPKMVPFIFVILWAVVPTVCVVVMDCLALAPMALTRYTLVGAMAFPVFAGLVIGNCKSNTGKLCLSVLVLAISVGQNPIAQNFAQNSERPELRAEQWKLPVQEINLREEKSDQPVFLFANLIEDVDAFKNDDPQFREYLLFPVQGLYAIDVANRTLIPCPTMPTTHFLDQHVLQSQQAGGAWVIVRSEPALVQEIADEFRSRSERLLDGCSPVISVMDSNKPVTGGLQNPVYLLSIDW
ncbi:MAG: hypothetical protein AB8B55_10940 [Mariniblastus sp.]